MVINISNSTNNMSTIFGHGFPVHVLFTCDSRVYHVAYGPEFSEHSGVGENIFILT